MWRFFSRASTTAVATVVLFAAPLLAQDAAETGAGGSPAARSTADTSTRADDDSPDLGWIGLAGLLGLAGLMRRDRTNHTDRDRGRTHS
jgi:MYXO-CTERM domain-containing protein